MINLTDYIKCYDNILDQETRTNIINNINFNDFERARIDDDTTESSYRNCYQNRLNNDFDKKIYEGVGKVLRKYAQTFQHFGTGLTTEDTGYIHLIYKGSEKGEYKTHTDHFDLHPRVLSCSFILNDEYDGGDFSFFEGEHIVKKKAGSVVVFPSNFCFPHAVTPVTNGDRHSIVTWIR